MAFRNQDDKTSVRIARGPVEGGSMVLLDEFTSLNDYLDVLEKERIPRPARCPNCGWHTVWFVGCYRRFVNLLLSKGERTRRRIPIRRCRCASCKKSFGLLPGCLYPHRQFGPESTEGVVSELLADPAASPGGFRGKDGLGPSKRTVRRWLVWLGSLKEATVPDQPKSRKMRPGRPSLRPPQFRGDPCKLTALGGEDIVRSVEEVLGRIRAWYGGRTSKSRSKDPCPLRSYMRWLWREGEGLLLLLTKGPWAPPEFYPMGAS